MQVKLDKIEQIFCINSGDFTQKQKLRMYKWRGCRTSKYFLLGGSPAFKYSVLYVPRTAYKDQA